MFKVFELKYKDFEHKFISFEHKFKVFEHNFSGGFVAVCSKIFHCFSPWGRKIVYLCNV